jgi:hypothetical protein
MIRWITFGSVLCVLMAPPADLFGQFNPGGSRFDPYAPGLDPRVRRAWREKAVAAVGPKARNFVETQGDEAVAAILACSRPVAVKLVEFYSSGELGKLPWPRALLGVIAQPRHGDDVALWAINHAGELSDSDSFDAYVSSPLEYALGLKQLATGAAEVRARRLRPAARTRMPWASLSADERLGIAVVAGLVIAGFLIWRRRNSGIC